MKPETIALLRSCVRNDRDLSNEEIMLRVEESYSKVFAWAYGTVDGHAGIARRILKMEGIPETEQPPTGGEE